MTRETNTVTVPLISAMDEDRTAGLPSSPSDHVIVHIDDDDGKTPLMSTDVQREAGGGLHNGTIKVAVLIWLTFQNSVHTLLLRYSRVRDVPAMFYSSVAVFWMEVFKVIFCLVMVVSESNGVTRGARMLKKQVFNQPWDTLRVCIPAMLYTLQNNLFYTAASHLDAATFMIVSQLKIFSTALFSIVLMRRSLIAAQWFSLAILFIGVSLVQLQSESHSPPPSVSHHVQPVDQKPLTHDTAATAGHAVSDVRVSQNKFIGFTTACLGCAISGFAGVFFEKILKGSAPVSIWMRNVQMSLFAVPCSLTASLLQDGHRIFKNGFLYGFDAVVWITVLWYCIGGLSVAVCIKYADNIAKNFATSVAIIIATIGSTYIFGFQPSAVFVAGAMLVIFSIFMYSSSAVFLKCFDPTALCRRAAGSSGSVMTAIRK